MLLVIASQYDQVARGVVESWQANGVDSALMHGSDLARRGWQLALGGGAGASVQGVIGNRVIDTSTLKGVITRLWAVSDTELPFIHAEDRVYAAAEMSAFLLGWLAALSCPVLNTPSAGCLAGPALSHEQWVSLAAAQKLRIRPVLRKIRYSAAGTSLPEPIGLAAERGSTLEVSVVRDQSFNAPDAAHAQAALELARAADVELLRVVFARDESSDTPLFVHADYWLNLADSQIANAVKECCNS